MGFKSDSRFWVVSLAAEALGHPTSQARSMGGEPTLGIRLGPGMSAIDLSVYQYCRLIETRVFVLLGSVLLAVGARDRPPVGVAVVEDYPEAVLPTCLATPSVLLKSFAKQCIYLLSKPKSTLHCGIGGDRLVGCVGSERLWKLEYCVVQDRDL